MYTIFKIIKTVRINFSIIKSSNRITTGNNFFGRPKFGFINS